jgi:membrane-associated protease RseP (regulator of RpoE activity)
LDQSPNTNHNEPVRPDDSRRTGSVSCRVEAQHPAANAAGSPSLQPADAPRTETAPPLTPAAWLANNAIYLVILGAAVGLIWYKLGLEGVWSAAKVVFGIGFVIFIHELGHFLTAKWCDVHVQTFSIGFGPALPGCSFQRGETTYKLAVLPLGGYVNMVGEGLETEEDESYPRSFKNKTVGQRMLIISAGVIMNVLLGCVLFIVVYYYHGVWKHPAVVGRVDAAGAMWTKGIPTGALVTKLDGIDDPTFENLQRKVILSATGEELPFTLRTFDDNGEVTEEKTVDLLPRKEANDPNPVVGVGPVQQLRLPPKPEKDLGLLPVVKDSPAVAARPIPVNKDEIIIATTDPDNPKSITEIKHDAKGGTFDYRELSRRILALQGKKMVVRVAPKGAEDKAKPSDRDVPLEGFQWNDVIIGCTEVQDAGSFNPFRIRELPRDPRHKSGDQRDPFVFRNRLRQLIDKPVVVQVRRGDPNNTSLREPLAQNGPLVNLFVPPAYHFTFGMRMKMGKVAGIRDGSPAARAGVQKGDELIKVVMIDKNGEQLYAREDLDPERLPFELAQAAAKRSGKKKVILTLRRESERAAKDIPCEPVEWDESWENDREAALGPASPLPIPQLGVAYWVLSQIVEVQPGSPAAKAGLKKDDTLREYRVRRLSEFSKELGWSDWSSLESKRSDNVVYDRWAMPYALLQALDFKEIQVKIKRPNEEVKEPIALTPVEDRSWPLVSRGLNLLSDYKLQKADTLGQALIMGGRETRDMIVLMYLQLRSLATGRVSVKGVGGPIAIGMQGFFIAQTGNFELLLFLGIISINLAVVNFLPIPILDGGHMVFLIYEKLRGRPPTERARVIATYIGLATIGFLMLFVFYQDIQNYVLKMFGS